jgi:uncharacterized caspase-like protein
MRENVSLTDEVKLAAGISLTEAVKGVAGRGVLDEELEAQDDASCNSAVRWSRRLLAAAARLVAFAGLAIALVLVGSGELDAELPTPIAHRRVALVVGNSAYRYTPRLENPKNDAADVGAALRKLGFHVIEGIDLDKAAFDRTVRDFAVALQGAEVGLFFYAGHGLQVSGRNYLVPVDAKLTTAAALDFEMVALDLVHRTMEREARTNILFFDACRDNPLSRNLAQSLGTRSAEIGRGLATVESGVGTLISFSTQPGNVARDGAGRNSPYASALVRQLAASSEDLTAILIAVRLDVMQQTDRKQVPWENSALTGRFYFNPPAPVPPPALAQRSPPAMQLGLSEAAEVWSATKDSTNVTVLAAFASRYRDTFYAELARARIEELTK